MPGTRSNAFPVHTVVHGYSSGALTAVQILTEQVMVFPGRIGAIKVYAVTAGTGGGNTVMDVLLNGTTIWTTAANKPTLAATSTGEFANAAPDVRAFQPGDRLTVENASISSTGHARVSFDIALELA